MADQDHTNEYIRVMNKRIAYAMKQRVLMGCVPYAEELDELFPIPKNSLIISNSEGRSHKNREEARDRAYGICGIGRNRARWVARIDRKNKVLSRYFERATDAAKWFNKMELKMNPKDPILCSIPAAELLDRQVLKWNHVTFCRNGEEPMNPEILQLIKERESWDARHTTY